MSTTKYTPGPWHVSGTSGREHEVRLLTKDGAIPIMGPDPDQEIKRIALVDCQTRFKRGQGWQTECDEREANARLIAAAPELLEALIAVNEILQMTLSFGMGFSDGHEGSPARLAADAIAKATGEGA
jgi:hypothetical protein